MDLEQGRRLAGRLRSGLACDFVAVSFTARRGDASTLAWQCVSGNTNNRYRRIFLPDGIGVLGGVYSAERPMVVRDAARSIAASDLYQFPIVAAEGLASFVSFPLYARLPEPPVETAAGAASPGGRRPDVIVLVAFRAPDRVDPGFLARAQGLACEDTGMLPGDLLPVDEPSPAPLERPAQVAHRIIRAQEAERKRIARELHDGIAQELLLAQIELRKLKYLPADEQPAGIARAAEQLGAVLEHVSALAADLRPAALDELGLAAAITAHCSRLERSFGIRTSFVQGRAGSQDERAAGRLSPDAQTALYRIFQEAAMNACKYSRSERLDVGLRMSGGDVVLEVRDYGEGFDTAHPEVRGGGLGLEGMAERAASIRGALAVESAPGRGTRVRVTVPAREVLLP